MKLLRKKQMDELSEAEHLLFMAEMELRNESGKTNEDALDKINNAMILIENIVRPIPIKKIEP